MKKLAVIMALAVLLPAAARAEPIAISVQSASGGFSGGDSATTTGRFAIDLGTVNMSAGSAGIFLVDGLKAGSDYTVSLVITGITAWDSLRAEILDPLDGDDQRDPSAQPAYVPAGYSTSNTRDGFSFAQDSALARSASFVGGFGSVTADETTDHGDILMFTGLGAGTARFTFGLRDRLGSRGFLVRLSANGASGTAPVPEPASMILLGTGLVGLALRRRRATAA